MDDRTVAGVRWAVTWLHERASEMNDPHARQVLHSAATNLGWTLQHIREGKTAREIEQLITAAAEPTTREPNVDEC